jgi:PAS domain S-box-containing protein
MTARASSSLIPLVAAALVHAVLVTPAFAAPSPSVRTVLVIQWSTEDFPSTPLLNAAIRQTFVARKDRLVDHFTEYLESDRFPPDVAFESLRDYIQRKYRDRHIDAVIAITEPAFEFATRYRATLFPDAPIVASISNVPEAGVRTEGRGITGLLSMVGDERTLMLALRLHPSTRRVFVVAYAPTLSYAERIKALRASAPGVEITFLGETSVDRLLEAVRNVPARSVILYIRHSQEDPGKPLFPTDIAALVSEAAPVPVYAISDQMIGTGVVGGVMRVPEQIGSRLAEMVLTILSGTPAHDIPFETVRLMPMFDWRQVRRWGIDPATLPADSVIRFRQPTVWELYRWYFLGAFTLLAAQSALIGGLLVQRRKLQRVEAALRESEAHFRVMADTAPVMIWKTNTERACDFVNLPWLTFTGRTLAEELGDGWMQVVHPDDLMACVKAYTTAFEAREMFHMEYRARRFDGEYRWILTTGVPRWESDGVFAGYIGSGLDITDRRQAEQTLQETHRELNRLSRLTALGEFAASIAHEVRQPLTAILLNARACLRGLNHPHPDLQELKEGLLDVAAAGQRAEQLIQRNRELFRFHNVQATPLDINGVITDTIPLIARRLTDNGVTLDLQLGGELPQVCGDPIELRQVLLNLAANAIDAMERVDVGSRRLRISSSRGDDHRIRIAVADSGIGLDDVDMRRLFELSYTTKATGTGVGLSISRSIVEAHGGGLSAERNPDRGATFAFTLPIAAKGAASRELAG